MPNRRNFLKNFLATVTGVAIAPVLPAVAAASEASLPKGLIYTKENPGKWAKKVKGHLPMVSVDGDKVRIETKHVMTEKHYIVRHTVVNKAGEVLAEKTFSPDDDEAVSEFKLEKGQGELYATSFCNKHDMWVATFTI